MSGRKPTKRQFQLEALEGRLSPSSLGPAGWALKAAPTLAVDALKAAPTLAVDALKAAPTLSVVVAPSGSPDRPPT
jgi:hypothetical protein